VKVKVKVESEMDQFSGEAALPIYQQLTISY
jgi:hypothetical protein